MVQIVSGAGIDRILTMNEVQEDRVARLNAARAAAARDERTDIREASTARQFQEDSLFRDAISAAESAADANNEQATTRRPRFADLVGNAEVVNRALEETQGVDRSVTEGERLRQASVLNDSFQRSYFIALIDPGRSMTMISPREMVQAPGDDQ